MFSPVRLLEQPCALLVRGLSLNFALSKTFVQGEQMSFVSCGRNTCKEQCTLHFELEGMHSHSNTCCIFSPPMFFYRFFSKILHVFRSNSVAFTFVLFAMQY